MVRYAARVLLGTLALTAVLGSEPSHVRVTLRDRRNGKNGAPRLHHPRPNSIDSSSVASATSEKSTNPKCPVAGELLIAAKQPAMTTLCPAWCGSESTCIYFPPPFSDQCESTTARKCLVGSSCAFQCVPKVATDESWLVSLYTDAAVVDEVIYENTLTELKVSVAINASLVTSWVGPTPNNVFLFYITGNEAANNYDDDDLPKVFADAKYVSPSDFVPFVLPMTSLDNLNVLEFLRVENLLFDQESTSAKKNLPALPSLVELHLTNMQLDYMPLEKDHVPALDTLSLSVNTLTRIDRRALPPDLSFLNLSNNAIEEVKPRDLPASLVQLDLTGNRIKEVVENTLPLSLVFLLLGENELITIPPDIERMAALELMDLQGNRLTEAAGRFPSLKSLDMRGNRLANLSALAAPSLETLQLAHNNLTEIPRISFDSPRLALLNLTGNPIRNYTPSMDEFSMLARISVLVLDQEMLASGCDDKNAIDLRGYKVCLAVGESAPARTGSNESSGSSVGLVLVNVLLIFTLLTMVALWWRRRHLHKQTLVELDKDRGTVSTSAVWGDAVLLQHRLDDQQILYTRLIGSGMFGEVWLAQYKSECVAVKRLKSVDTEMIDAFVQEIKTVAALDHPRIVQFIGVVWTKESDISLVTEFMEGGDLRSYLSSCPKSDSGNGGWRAESLQIAVDITEALVYLHSLDPVVMHRDLKSRNVLLDSELRGKLSDFGVSRLKAEDTTMTAGVGTVRWAAPEVLAGKVYDESADIYSLGVILGELDTHKLPYEDSRDEDGQRLTETAIMALVVAGSLSPTLSEPCPTEIRLLIERCTAFEPDQRPNAIRVAHTLRTLLHSFSLEQESTSELE